MQLTEAHRDHYNDKSGTVPQVTYFTGDAPEIL